MMTPSGLWETLARGGDRPFFIRPGGTTSHAQFQSLVGRALGFLGFSPHAEGDRVIVLLEDEVMASAAFTAALLAGLAPVMLPADTGTRRLEAIVRTLEPARVITDHSVFSAAEAVPPDLRSKDADQLAYLIFTSGTTAEPSGVEITRGNLFSHLDTLIRLFGFDAGTRIFNPTPMSHTDGLIFGLMLALATGGSVVRPGPLDLAGLEPWIGMLREQEATHMVTNPTVLHLIDRSCRHDDPFRSARFRGIISSASHLRAAFWHRFEARFGTRIWNLYGLTETVTSALYAGDRPHMGAAGTLGKPVDCEARVVPLDPAVQPAGDGAAGELQLRGAHIFRGYWRNPERTAAAFTPDGWMKTGDLVRKRSDGAYEFLGRIKSAINSGGTLIRPEEIDECLLRHPAVSEAVTVGLEDDGFEEIAISAVVLSGQATEATLAAHCRSGLEMLKVPKRIISVASIPRGDAGKPHLNALRDMLREAMSGKNARGGPEHSSIEQDVIGLAALVFRADPGELTLASSAQTVPGWDSFTHLNLALQAEDDFSVRIAGDEIPRIRTLGDLAQLIRRLKGPGPHGGT